MPWHANSAPSPERVVPALTAAEIMEDLEAGRSRPLHRPQPLTLASLRRPTLGGRTFIRTYLLARALGRLHPRLARRPLARLWLTPWVHPSSLDPIREVPPDLATWWLDVGGPTLRGFAGGAGRTVVLVHGWAGRAADWRHLAVDLITAGWRVVAPDLPAHGMTAGRTTNLFELGAALADVLRHERPDEVVVHSFGFPITMRAIEVGADPPGTLIALAPGRSMRHALQRFAERSRLGHALTDELHRAMQARFGDDIWDVLDVDRFLLDLPSRGIVIHDTDDADIAIDDGRHIAKTWRGASFVATHGLGHRRILRDTTVRRLVTQALGTPRAAPW